MIGTSEKKEKNPLSVTMSLRAHTFQRKKAARAANIRPVLPAAVTRSAPFLPGAVVFVAESVGFKSPELAVVCEGVVTAAGVITAVFDGEVVVDVVLDWVMANCAD
jgi:hypothetical protein